MSKWLEFVERSRTSGPGSTAKTRTWAVQSKTTGAVLGYVQWFGRWRQYCFYPVVASVFNAGCLCDIKAFCEKAMADWRKERGHGS